MEGLLFLALMYWVFKKITGAAKKQTKKKRSSEEWTKQMVEQLRRAQKQVQNEKQISMPEVLAQPVGEGESCMEYTYDAHGCVSQQQEYMGSLGMDSSEGEDACDLQLGHEREYQPEPESVYANPIGSEPVLDFSARGLYQGVVMSEILARPDRRMRRRT